MKTVNIKFSRANKWCTIPSKSLENAGLDIYVDPVWFAEEENGMVVMYPNDIKVFKTGIRSVIPNTHYYNIAERGSTGIKGLSYRAGIIDSGYRGEWNIIINNTSNNAIIFTDDVYQITEDDMCDIYRNASMKRIQFDEIQIYSTHKGIAQAILHEVPLVNIEEITEEEVLATESERGEGKFGSSGK